MTVGNLGKLAESGEPDSLSLLSLMNHDGIGIPKNDRLARQLIAKTSKVADPFSRTVAGLYYLKGWSGFQKDHDRGDDLLFHAAAGGCIFAQATLGRLYAMGGEYEKDKTQAMLWYGMAAQQGDLLSQEGIGDIFLDGDDGDDAEFWYRKAAARGSISAERKLGSLLAESTDTTTEAMSFYKLAAQRGDAQSEYDLGTLYRTTRGPERDLRKSYQFLRLAAVNPDQSFRRQSVDQLYDIRDTLPPDLRASPLPSGESLSHLALRYSQYLFAIGFYGTAIFYFFLGLFHSLDILIRSSRSKYSVYSPVPEYVTGGTHEQLFSYKLIFVLNAFLFGVIFADRGGWFVGRHKFSEILTGGITIFDGVTVPCGTILAVLLTAPLLRWITEFVQSRR